MKYIDISVALQEQMIIYEGDPEFAILAEPSNGLPGDPDFFRITVLSMCTHTGTHVDAPVHVGAGDLCVDGLSLDDLCGPALVLDLRGCGNRIDRATLQKYEEKIRGTERLLLKTDNGKLMDRAEEILARAKTLDASQTEQKNALLKEAFSREYAHLTADGAEYLRREVGIRLIGIDYLSVERWPTPWPGFGFPAHHALLDGENPVVILETIDL